MNCAVGSGLFEWTCSVNTGACISVSKPCASAKAFASRLRKPLNRYQSNITEYSQSGHSARGGWDRSSVPHPDSEPTCHKHSEEGHLSWRLSPRESFLKEIVLKCPEVHKGVGHRSLGRKKGLLGKRILCANV